MEFTITETEKDLRLDQFLAEKLEISRTQSQSLITKAGVLINNKAVKKNYKLCLEDFIQVVNLEPEVNLDLEPINEPLTIVYQDDNLAVINKPPFIPVHPDRNFSHKKTIVNLLLGNKMPVSKLGGASRPGIVHRLDMDTSGLLIVAKTDLGYKCMRQQFEAHQVVKTYICLVIGELESKKGLIEAPIARNPHDRKKMAVQASTTAKVALSQFKVIKNYYWEKASKVLSLLEVKIPTGRTHQIRVHFAAIGHPLIGDNTYGNNKLNKEAHLLGLKRQFLHAHKLQFVNTEDKVIKLTTELPEDLVNFLSKLPQM